MTYCLHAGRSHWDTHAVMRGLAKEDQTVSCSSICTCPLLLMFWFNFRQSFIILILNHAQKCRNSSPIPFKFLFAQLSLQEWMSHVIINFAEHLTESITNARNSLPFSVNFFTQQICSETPKLNNDLQSKSTRKRCYIMKKNISRNVIFKVLTCAIPDNMRDEIRLTHPYMFTFPSCVWTFWSTAFSLCPGCLCSICNMTNIHSNQYLQWFVIGVPNVSTAYVATFLSRLLMSLSKGLFAWAFMRHSLALWYSCSSM